MQGWRERYQWLNVVLLLAVRTARGGARTRVVGLAAEAAFFSLLSLPALLLGVLGALGHLTSVIGPGTVEEIRRWLLHLATLVLTAETVESVVVPLVDEFLRGAQSGILSITFLVSLWSGSRAMNVFVDAITIAYGLDGLRGFVWQRVLAFIAYIGALLFTLIVLPVLVAGPNLIRELLPFTAEYLHLAYWPVVGGLSAVAVALLYTLSVPVRISPLRYLAGALLAMAILLLGSALLRLYLEASLGQVTIYGTLAAPIAILIWLWVMSFAVLIGSALNAEIDSMWPTARTAEARAEIASRRHASATRLVERREQALRDVTGEQPVLRAEGETSEGESVRDRASGDRAKSDAPGTAPAEGESGKAGEEEGGTPRDERDVAPLPEPRTGAYPARGENGGERGVTSARPDEQDRLAHEPEE